MSWVLRRLQGRDGAARRGGAGQPQKLLGQGSWWKGGEDPRESSSCLLLRHTFSLVTSGKPSKPSVSVLWAPAIVAKRRGLPVSSVPSWGGPSRLPSVSCSSWSAGRGLHVAERYSQGSAGAFPKSAGCVGGSGQGALLPLTARPFPWQPLPTGVARWRPGSRSVILALVPQFQPFLEPGRVQLPRKGPHTTLLFSLFRLSAHGAVGGLGWGGGRGQVHLRLLQHGGHIQLLRTKKGDGTRSHPGRGEVTSVWAHPPPNPAHPTLTLDLSQGPHPLSRGSFLLPRQPASWPACPVCLPSCSRARRRHLYAPWTSQWSPNSQSTAPSAHVPFSLGSRSG